MELTIWLWLGAAVIFGIVEALTAGLVSIWFVAGSLAGFVAALLHLSPVVQMVVFVVATVATLALTRPLVRRFTAAKAEATNADRALGQEAKVTETIDNENAAGAVYVYGKTWTARSADGSVIPEGARVRVQKMEGVKLFVEKIEAMEDVK